MKIEFEGKTVIVTGAAHGIGRAIAASFVTHGAQVFACDVNTVGLAETQRICGKSCETVSLDVGDQVAVRTAVSKIEVARNGIDILVNNDMLYDIRNRRIQELNPKDGYVKYEINLK